MRKRRFGKASVDVTFKPIDRQTLDALRVFRDEHDWYPTVRELGVALGLHSYSPAKYRLDRLVSLGLLHRDPGNARSIRLTEEGLLVAVGDQFGVTIIPQEEA